MQRLAGLPDGASSFRSKAARAPHLPESGRLQITSMIAANSTLKKMHFRCVTSIYSLRLARKIHSISLNLQGHDPVPQGHFITVEGGEGVGKSTQCGFLIETLKTYGIDA